MPYEPIRLGHLNQMLSKLREAIYEPIAQLNVKAWVTPEPVPFEERMSGQQITLSQGEHWGSYGIVPGFVLQGAFHRPVVTPRLFFYWT